MSPDFGSYSPTWRLRLSVISTSLRERKCGKEHLLQCKYLGGWWQLLLEIFPCLVACATCPLLVCQHPPHLQVRCRAHVPVGYRHVGGLWSSEASMGSCPSQDQSEPDRVGCGCANSWWDAFLVIPSLVCCQRGFAAVPSGSEGFSGYPVTLGTGDLTGSAGFALQRLKPLFTPSVCLL